MALTDSTTGKIIRNYSIEELEDAANLMRGYDLVALHAAGSGHAGGTLSIMVLSGRLLSTTFIRVWFGHSRFMIFQYAASICSSAAT